MFMKLTKAIPKIGRTLEEEQEESNFTNKETKPVHEDNSERND